MTKDLSGQIAIITGGASGLGRGSALAFAKKGVHVVLADLDLAGAEETARMVRELGREAIAVQCDVGQDDAFGRLRDAVLQRFGRFDIIMNNAGVLAVGPPEVTPVSEWERVLNINTLSVARSMKAFLAGLIAQGGGHIVNVASTAGLYPYAYDRLSYGASKAAMIVLSEGLALYCLPRGVGVSVFCPGPMTTNIRQQMTFWGGLTAPRSSGAQYKPVSLETAGEMLVDTVVEGRFVGYTHAAQSVEQIRKKYEDWDGYIKLRAAEIFAEESGQ
jgi:NAD(P)-dependent dehydrogenase (short-subunit alcohol dehydrogenase family)